MQYLFCSLASHGLLYPSIGIALALRKRGHRVAFVTGPAFSDLLCSVGCERIPRGDQDGPSFQIEHWGVAASAAIQVKHIEYALRQFQPDMLVGQHLTLGPLMVAEREDIPVASVAPFSYLWPYHSSPHPPRSVREDRLRWRYDDLMQIYNRTRQFFRLPLSVAPPEEAPFLGDAFLLQNLDALIESLPELPERVHLVGSCLWEPAGADADLIEWLDMARASGEPILYVQHGRFFGKPGFWPHLVAVCRERPIRVVAAVGRMDSAVGEIASNFFVRGHIPQGAVLPYAHAVIGNGNTTAVLGALTHGLPSLLIPGGGEQPDVAEECERLGVARVLPPEDVTGATLCQALEAVLGQEDLRQRARSMQHAFSEIDGPQRCADLLEHLAATRQPMRRSMVEAEQGHTVSDSWR